MILPKAILANELSIPVPESRNPGLQDFGLIALLTLMAGGLGVKHAVRLDSPRIYSIVSRNPIPFVAK